MFLGDEEVSLIVQEVFLVEGELFLEEEELFKRGEEHEFQGEEDTGEVGVERRKGEDHLNGGKMFAGLDVSLLI